MRLFKNLQEYNESVKKRINSKYVIDHETGCWNWTGRKDKNGYGEIQIQNPIREKRRVTRITYSLNVGLIPDGMLVCHTCDNPSCINPDHLFLGTNKDNLVDASKKGRLKGRRGEECPTAKLTKEQVLKIRSIKHLTHETIAGIYNIHPGYVSLIQKKKRWKHI